MARLRYNNAVGSLGAVLASGGTTITFVSAPPFATLSGSDYIPLVVDPPGSSPNPNFEIVYLTAYTAGATTGTISRGQGNTTAVAHASGATWASAPVVKDAAPEVLPSNAGVRQRSYDPLRCAYNFNPTTAAALRVQLAKALDGELAAFTAIGDSKTAGLGTGANSNSMATEGGWPAKTLLQLAGRGYAIAGTGCVLGNQNAQSSGAPTGANDPRWSLPVAWQPPTGDQQFPLLQCTTANQTATFTSNRAGTNIDIYYPDNSGQFSYSIDGAAAVTVTPGGTSAMKKVSLTGQTNATHTVAIKALSATATYILGVDVYNAVGLKVHNLGISSSTSGDWSGSIGTFYENLPVAQFLNSPVTFISLGTNDCQGSLSVASFKSNMQTIIPNVQAYSSPVLIVPQGPPAAPGTPWDGFVTATYDLADQYELPLVDFTALMQDNFTTALNLGLMNSGSPHETSLGYRYEAQTLATLIG